MMKFRRPQQDAVEINLTPMIDCLMFLLVFLLISTSFNQYSRLHLLLPEATGVPPAKKEKHIEITIDAQGDYVVDGRALGAAEDTALSAAVREEVEKKGVVPLVISADGKAAHQSVVRAMDVAGKLGIVNINISTRLPRGQ